MSTPDLPLRMQQLKLHGMASQWPELLAKMRLHTMEPEHWMAELLQAESAERQVRAQANQMKAARFPVHRDLLGFDFAASPLIAHWSNDSTRVTSSTPPRTSSLSVDRAPARPTWPPPSASRPCASIACVRFFSTIELVNALEKEQAQGKAGQIALRLTYADLVILDELGYLPFTPQAARCCST